MELPPPKRVEELDEEGKNKEVLSIWKNVLVISFSFFFLFMSFSAVAGLQVVIVDVLSSYAVFFTMNFTTKRRRNSNDSTGNFLCV